MKNIDRQTMINRVKTTYKALRCTSGCMFDGLHIDEVLRTENVRVHIYCPIEKVE